MSKNPVLSLCKPSTESSATPGKEFLKRVSKLSVDVTFTVVADVYNKQDYFKLCVLQFTYLQEFFLHFSVLWHEDWKGHLHNKTQLNTHSCVVSLRSYKHLNCELYSKISGNHFIPHNPNKASEILGDLLLQWITLPLENLQEKS